MRIGIIGAGLIGGERVEAVAKLKERGRAVNLLGVYDENRELSQKSASKAGTTAFDSAEALLNAKPDWLIIALPHDVAVPVTLQALSRGFSVLAEKPMGRDLETARKLAKAGGNRLRIGYNYRFFPGIRHALQDARRGVFGRMIAAHFLIGHGCAPGQEKTWKLNAERAGGGCLIDPGVHLLDLCLLLASERIEVVGGTTWSGFWNTGIEEDVQLLLKAGDISISLHISIVCWRSTFRMELHGTEGYGLVSGRSRSYGSQKYVTGRRWGWRSAPSQTASETAIVESDGSDVYSAELEELLFPNANSERAWPSPSTATEALRVMELLDCIRERLKLPRHYA